MVAIKVPSRSEAPVTNVVVQLSNASAANELIDNGLVFDYQLFRPERYADWRPIQCFKCYQFGNRAQFCRSLQRCGNCPALRHGSNKPSC